ncbi:SdpA family antimicrobial peptide system protein [Streptomyces xiamenensis]|uniref:SdpA family antimicrobial peptide system protein n=1 Tax=Streptomyces xiamenensis TaxID=408015 RepID=UPI0036EE32DC
MRRTPDAWKRRLPLGVDGPLTTRVPRQRLWAVAAAWALALLYVAQAHLPGNVITLPGQHTVTPAVRSIAPQGWGFFTKSPREIELQPYVLRDGAWVNASLAPHGEPRHWLGFDRRSRSQGIEMALLINEAPGLTWTDCERGTLTGCLASAAPPGPAVNRTPAPTLCGTVAVIQQKPVPFAWRDLLAGSHTPDRLTVLDVTC